MTVFYLGTHRPHHLTNGRAEGPLFVSANVLRARKSPYAPATVPWALDSGGFTEITRKGRYSTTPKEYAALVSRLASQLGAPDFAAIQDYMCEDIALRKTGLSLTEHQQRTVRSFLELRDISPGLPWLPVVQGRTLSDYLACIEMYAVAGVDLRSAPRVGLGSVCRRQATTEIIHLIHYLSRFLALHGFGVKILGLGQLRAGALKSSDSMAWSHAARRRASRPTVAANSQEVAEAYRSWVNALIWTGETTQPRQAFNTLLATYRTEHRPKGYP